MSLFTTEEYRYYRAFLQINISLSPPPPPPKKKKKKNRSWLVSCVDSCLLASVATITIYFIHPNGKLKLLFDHTNEEHISIIQSHETNAHIHTLRHMPPFSQSAYTNRNDLMLIPSKPKITWNNAFSVKAKRKNSQIKFKKKKG